jgi:hypothetical protein
MERPPERNGKTQMISGIQDISLGQKHRWFSLYNRKMCFRTLIWVARGWKLPKLSLPVRPSYNSTRSVARDSPVRDLGNIPWNNSHEKSDHQLLTIVRFLSISLKNAPLFENSFFKGTGSCRSSGRALQKTLRLSSLIASSMRIGFCCSGLGAPRLRCDESPFHRGVGGQAFCLWWDPEQWFHGLDVPDAEMVFRSIRDCGCPNCLEFFSVFLAFFRALSLSPIFPCHHPVFPPMVLNTVGFSGSRFM